MRPPSVHRNSKGDDVQTVLEHATDSATAPLEEAVRALQVENEQLRHALESRIVIEQAKGAVAVRCGVAPDVAFEMIRGLARSQRRKMAEFCAEVIENEGRLDGASRLDGRTELRLHT
jgi:AmiR/NasT family two-component response regulator